MKARYLLLVSLFGLSVATPIRQDIAFARDSDGYHQKYADKRTDTRLIRAHFWHPEDLKTGIDDYLKPIHDVKPGPETKHLFHYKEPKFNRMILANLDEFDDRTRSKLHMLINNEDHSMISRAKREADPHQLAVQAYQNLSPERKLVYKKYFSVENFTTEEDGLRWAIGMMLNDNDVYQILKLIQTELVNKIQNEELREFMKFYYGHIESMKNLSQEEFDKFTQEVRAVWSKLSTEAKQELAKESPDTKYFLDDDPYHIAKAALAKLTPEKKAIWDKFFGPDGRSEEDEIRWEVKMRLTEPQIFRVIKLFKTSILHHFENKELKQFMKYYHERVDDIKDESDEEYERYKKEVKAKYQLLSDDAKVELGRKYEGTKLLLDGDPLQEARQAYQNLSPERKLVYKTYFSHKNFDSEEEALRWAIGMMLNDKDIYAILKSYHASSINKLQNEELKEFLRNYYARLEKIQDNSEEEFTKFTRDVREMWKGLEKEAKQELIEKYPIMQPFLEDLNDLQRAFYSLPSDRREVFRTYLNNTKEMPEEDIHRLNVRISVYQPDIYRLIKIMYAQAAKDFEGSEEGREFIKYYYWRAGQMPDNSPESYTEFIKVIKVKWLRLDPEVRSELTDKFGDIEAIIERNKKVEAHRNAYKALTDEQKANYKQILDNREKMTAEEDLYWMLKIKQNDSDVYNVIKLLFAKNLKRFKSKELNDFLEFYSNRFDSVNTLSEIEDYKKDVRTRWSHLEESLKVQLNKVYPGTVMFLNNDPILNTSKLIDQLSPERRAVYNQYMATRMPTTEKEYIDFSVSIRLKDPDIFEIFKIYIRHSIIKLKTEKAKEFMNQYFALVDRIPDRSSEEFDKFVKEARIKWHELEESTKNEIGLVFPETKTFLES